MSSDSESINEIVIEEKFAIAIDDLVQVLKSNRPGTKRKSRHLTGHQHISKESACFRKKRKNKFNECGFLSRKKKSQFNLS